MACYRLSKNAVQDVKSIYRYSLENFGGHRANEYAADMEACLSLLTDNPEMGRDFAEIREGLRRHEHQSHVIYYRKDKNDILILRILGAAQDPARHL